MKSINAFIKANKNKNLNEIKNNKIQKGFLMKFYEIWNLILLIFVLHLKQIIALKTILVLKKLFDSNDNKFPLIKISKIGSS